MRIFLFAKILAINAMVPDEQEENILDYCPKIDLETFDSIPFDMEVISDFDQFVTAWYQQMMKSVKNFGPKSPLCMDWQVWLDAFVSVIGDDSLEESLSRRRQFFIAMTSLANIPYREQETWETDRVFQAFGRDMREYFSEELGMTLGDSAHFLNQLFEEDFVDQFVSVAAGYFNSLKIYRERNMNAGGKFPFAPSYVMRTVMQCISDAVGEDVEVIRFNPRHPFIIPCDKYFNPLAKFLENLVDEKSASKIGKTKWLWKVGDLRSYTALLKSQAESPFITDKSLVGMMYVYAVLGFLNSTDKDIIGVAQQYINARTPDLRIIKFNLLVNLVNDRIATRAADN